MTMSTSVGGTTVIGVVVGTGVATGTTPNQAVGAVPAAATNSSVISSALHELPFTGLSHLMMLISLGLICLMAGILMIGLVRRPSAANYDGELGA